MEYSQQAIVYYLYTIVIEGNDGHGNEKDMKTGEECAEEVVQRNDKCVPPLLAVVELEVWVLIRVLCERKGCMHVVSVYMHG